MGSYTLFATPSLFKKLLSILVSSALIFSIIQAYLKVNKIWKRRKNVEVANSISIVAAMLGFAVGLPFLMNNISSSNSQSVSFRFRPYLTMSQKSNINAIETLILSQSNVSGGFTP